MQLDAPCFACHVWVRRRWAHPRPTQSQPGCSCAHGLGGVNGYLQAPGGTYVTATYVGQALLGNATAPLGAPTPDAFSDGLLLGLDMDLNVRSETVMCPHTEQHICLGTGLYTGACPSPCPSVCMTAPCVSPPMCVFVSRRRHIFPCSQGELVCHGGRPRRPGARRAGGTAQRQRHLCRRQRMVCRAGAPSGKAASPR